MSKMKSPARTLVILGCLLVLAACTTRVTVEGTAPTPLVAKIPANIGVHYSEQFKNYTHREVLPQGGGKYEVALGQQNHEFFQNLLGSLFLNVEEVGEPPLDPAIMARLDGVVVPRIVKFGFLTPHLSGLKFYSASIEYEVEIIDQSGTSLGAWKKVGYGKSEGGFLQGDEALEEATMQAIRDGGARIAIELGQEPPVRRWVDGLRARGTATEGEAQQ